MARRYQANGTPAAASSRSTRGGRVPVPAGRGVLRRRQRDHRLDELRSRTDRTAASTASASTPPEPSSGPSSTSTRTRPTSRARPSRWRRRARWRLRHHLAERRQDGDNLGCRRSTSTATGKRLGVELPVNDFTTGLQGAPHVAAQPNGQYVAVWDSVGTTATAAASPRAWPASRASSRRRSTCFTRGSTPRAAPTATASSSRARRSIVEPGVPEQVADPLPLTGTASNFPGPARARPTRILDATADYGTIAPAATNDCFHAPATAIGARSTGTRPARSTGTRCSTETLSYNGFTRIAALHVGGSFPDVPQNALLSVHREPLPQRRDGRLRRRRLLPAATTSRARRWRSSC